MPVFFLILLIAAVIYYFGWYSFPENINPDDHQVVPDKNRLMKGAEPFFLRGNSDTGFLIIHGYESTPYSLRNLGDILHSQGHSVFAPLLPGHGTNLKDLTGTRYEHWYEAARRVYVRERLRYKKFFIIGFSLGGNIALRLSVQFRSTARNHDGPSGLILVAAPVVLNGFLNGALVVRDWRLIFSGIGKFFMRPVSKSRDLVSSEILNPNVNYSEAYSLPPLHSFRVNAPKIKPYLKYITIPTCLIHASNDWTIDSENMHYIMRNIRAVEKRAYMFEVSDDVSTRHDVLTHEQTRDKVIHYILSFLEDQSKNFQYGSEIIPRPRTKKGIFRW